MRVPRRWALAALLLMLAVAAPAATLSLAPGQSLPEVLVRAADGDTIEIAAGDYRGETAVIRHKQLTLRGVGGRPVFHAGERLAEDKAILVVRNGDIRIENLEFRGARVPDRNGAGIRFERGHLEVLRCAFFDNENGILAGNDAQAELVVRDSEFAQAPSGGKLPHLLYVGRLARFTLSGSYFHGGSHAHLVKSRARYNEVRHNRIVDDAEGTAAYELEFPNGGTAWVLGNVIGQARGTTNAVLVSYGAEGTPQGEPVPREHLLVMAHNTLLSSGPGIFLRVHERALVRPVAMNFVNNLSVGFGSGEPGLADITRGNFAVPASVLPEADAGRYALAADSWLRGRGVDPGFFRGRDLHPLAEFSPPVGTRPLPQFPLSQRLSPGAFQN